MTIEYLDHDGERVRVRQSTWAPDQFDVISWEEFKAWRKLTQKLLPGMVQFEEIHLD